jgi:dCMP deaminase
MGINLRVTKYAYFMDIAKAVARRSSCLSRQVGCILVDKYDHILATGYNGPPRGVKHCETCLRLEPGRDLYKCQAVHAEMNALLQCKDVNSIRHVFITVNPCEVCLRMLANTAVKSIFCDSEYTSVSAEYACEFCEDRKIHITFGTLCGNEHLKYLELINATKS